MYSKYPYILAMISGFILPLAANIEPFPIPLIILCLLVSGALGFFGPGKAGDGVYG